MTIACRDRYNTIMCLAILSQHGCVCTHNNHTTVSDVRWGWVCGSEYFINFKVIDYLSTFYTKSWIFLTSGLHQKTRTHICMHTHMHAHTCIKKTFLLTHSQSRHAVTTHKDHMYQDMINICVVWTIEISGGKKATSMRLTDNTWGHLHLHKCWRQQQDTAHVSRTTLENISICTSAGGSSQTETCF